MLWHQKDNMLWTIDSSGSMITMDASLGIAGFVLQSNEAFLSNQYHQDIRYHSHVDEVRTYTNNMMLFGIFIVIFHVIFMAFGLV